VADPQVLDDQIVDNTDITDEIDEENPEDHVGEPVAFDLDDQDGDN
jgi:hypothetical protein